MILTKSVIVNGEYRNVNHQKVYDLSDRIDTAVIDVQKGIKGKVVDVKTSIIVAPSAANGGSALVQVLYEGSETETGKKGGK